MGGYEDFTPALRLAEREALTFQNIRDDLLIRAFYREAYHIRELYFEKCSDPESKSLYQACAI